MAAFVFVLFGLVAAGLVYLQYRVRQVRIQAAATVAARIGFTFSRDDANRVGQLPFSLFQQGKGRKAQLVISGIHNDLPLSLFDYEYFVQGNKSREYHRFTCAVLTIPAACPPLRIANENVFTRLGDHLVHTDVKLEYDDFNRRFHVNCHDQKFAFTLLDGKMMQWLIDARSVERVEVVGPWILVATKRIDPRYWLELGSWLDSFRTHIPPVLYKTYPPT